MRLEEIIKQKRDQLDVEQVPLDTWEKIKADWKKDTKSSFHWWKAAAIVFISTSIALLYYSFNLQNKVEKLASLGDISIEYKEIEDQYLTEIKSLEASISYQEVTQNEDLAWIAEEMQILEEINEIYRQDIGQIADQEQVVNALIDYYEKKIKLLRKIELEINRTEKFKENEKGNTDDIST